MKFLRYLIGIPLAALITGLLFIMLYEMIRVDGTTVPQAAEEVFDTFVRQKENPPPEPEPEPDPDDLPPRPKEPRPKGPDGIPVDSLDEGPKPIGPGDLPGRPGGGGPVGPVITPTGFYPLTRTAPLYPPACAAREVEGQVVVEFDVTNGGEVLNARVVSSTDSCLEKAALRAISGWKYTPLIGADPDGIRERGLRQIFDFQLDTE